MSAPWRPTRAHLDAHVVELADNIVALGVQLGPDDVLAEWARLTTPRPGPVDPAVCEQCRELRDDLRAAAARGYGVEEITECMLAHMRFGHPDDHRVFPASLRSGRSASTCSFETKEYLCVSSS
ncbi:hypothetical protein [Streptomyces sp. 2P-4]|uniref:hypothetical protein n=1 Tax=Streptomyces sp. 2P-4 TaxID=2931974 RepID=UPI002541C8D4|nr:hypothetical protein [Streptomyces sp. 2P-4]